MKRVAFLLSFISAILTTQASAQSDFAITMDISGVSTDGQQITQLLLDLDIGTRFMPANGAVVLDGIRWAPATGTCYVTLLEGIFCNVQTDQASMTIDLAPDLAGQVFVKNAIGNIAETGFATIVSVE